MRISDLRRRIVLQRKTTIRDEEGNTVETWVDVVTVWAAVEPMSIRWKEFLQAAAINAERYTLFRIRYRPGITPDMRVVYAGQTYDIVHVVDIAGRHRELHIIAKDVVAGG